jgi:hypothetical protein
MKATSIYFCLFVILASMVIFSAITTLSFTPYFNLSWGVFFSGAGAVYCIYQTIKNTKK